MTTDPDNLTPQQRLAKIVAEVTDDGRRVVQFFMQVADGKLDHEDFKPNHRMDAAKELVKIGLTEFADYVPPSKPRAPRRKSADADTEQISPEIQEAREELAKYARELTGDGRTVIRLYSEVMDGFRNDEGFKPHHRIAAGRELLLRGFGPMSTWTQPELADTDTTITDHQPNQTNHSSDRAPAPQTQEYPTLVLTPTVSEYISEAVEAYKEQSPLRQMLPQRILDRIDGDEPQDECPCLIAEGEGRDIPCTEDEQCPYHGIEWPEFSEEDIQRSKEHVMRGLRMRLEMMGVVDPSQEDP